MWHGRHGAPIQVCPNAPCRGEITPDQPFRVARQPRLGCCQEVGLGSGQFRDGALRGGKAGPRPAPDRESARNSASDGLRGDAAPLAGRVRRPAGDPPPGTLPGPGGGESGAHRTRPPDPAAGRPRLLAAAPLLLYAPPCHRASCTLAAPPSEARAHGAEAGGRARMRNPSFTLHFTKKKFRGGAFSSFRADKMREFRDFCHT